MPQIMLMKAEYLVLLSLLLTTVVITNAFYIKKQFYPSVVYLTKSSTSLAVLYVQAFVFVILFETCLAFTVFRDDFSPRFVALFAILLFLKCFHWLLEDRVDYMEQSPVLGTIFHARVVGLLSVLCLLDYLFISSAYMHTIAKGASVQIVFGFEYAILLVSVISTAIKYILHSIEIRAGEQWENKGVFMLYSDLILGFFRLTLYMIFIIVMMKIHTFPLFAIRPMFIAMRSFRKSCNDVLESRRAIRNLNTMYPDLTAEELANVADTTCIICREEMQVQQSIKRLSCQHIFHKNCLRSWFQRQQTCPICRTTVLRPTPPRAGGVAAGAAAAPPPPPPNGQPAAASQAQAQIPVSPVRFVAPPPLSPSASAAPTSSSSTSNNTTTTTQASPPNSNTMGVGIFPQIPFNPCPMVLPPFAFPPPPLPPTDFTGMSEETIRAMEGTELAHVQARIQCLRNVRTLLDASMIQMQQYMNIVLTQSNMENGPHLLSNLKNDLDQVLSSSENNNSTNNILNSMDENDADVIRRRRLEHYANRFSPSTTNQDNNNNNNDS
ncbi:unnamed protein product [Rotaria sp. Silwood1]|nr:unnamed protein product [Rotaria sp. Silwood1]